ncbi:MAG TPA: hypothetical protein VHN77_14735 [Phycisphaerales bacterium]|nr:hypothetical protein [Phycisphaerales bacterium]
MTTPGPIRLIVLAGFAAACASAPAQQEADEGPVIVGETKSKWRAFELNRFGAALEFLGRSRRDSREQEGQPDLTDSETLMRELLELNGRAFIGHKNLVDLTATVKFGLEDRFLDSGTAQAEDHSSDFTTLFDINAHALGNSKVPLDVYARREQQFLERDFASSVTNTTTETGVMAAIQSITAPTTIKIFRNESTQDDQLGQFDFSQEQNTFFLHSTLNLADRHRLEVEYTFDDITERQGATFENAYQRHNLQLTDVYTFGDEKLSELRSYLRYYDQSGRFPLRLLRWDERLLLTHTRRLETRYNFSAERQTFADSDQDHFDASAHIKHRLFESLVSTGTVGTRRFEDSSDFTSTEWYVNGELEYTKKVPGGRLDVTVGASFNAQDNSERGSTIRVLDESQTFNDPFPIVISRPRVVPGSIEVTGATGFPIYQEGFHYTVQFFPDRVEIRIILGRGINDGDTLLIDYDVAPTPASTVDTTGLTASVRYTIAEGSLIGLSSYAIYRRQDHSVDSTDPTTLIFDDTSTFTYGLEYRRDGWRFKGEREHQESSFTPYEATRFEAAYDHQFSRGSTAGVDATYEMIEYSNPENTLEFARLSFRWNETLAHSTDALLRVDLRDEQDSLRGSSRGVDSSLTINWRKRQTTAYVTVRATLLEADTSEQTTQFLEVGFRREF